VKILVIEDTEKNIDSAKSTLPGHDVTICTSIQTAFSTLRDGQQQFDVLLTDLFLPIGEFRGMVYPYSKPLGELPAGLVFALKAVNLGMSVVIVTDTDHHKDWICTLLDLLYPDRSDSNRRIAYVEARNATTGDYDNPTKDWGKAIEMADIPGLVLE